MRLGDCSSGMLGNLPQDPVGVEYDEGDEEEGGCYEDEEPARRRAGDLVEPRELSEECRRTSVEGEHASVLIFVY